MDYAKLTAQARQAAEELLQAAHLETGDIFVVGCSSSEIMGGHIGKDSSMEAAAAVLAGVLPPLQEQGVYLAAQCCEHLNRSIVIEREAANDAERATIASVIYNRLNIGMPLQLDSTVVYAIRETGETTMSTELIQATDSPYNTYLYQGLPPGPICNPGMKSIEAALNPEQTGYYYFALDMETKSMRFFATLAEHEAFVATQDYG